mmetsp:Transcript_27552/g.64043  ORF Transcript_27552/g.64043 Transcript_27552/m.64043 type:complete len:237 (-) Transcript_27552:252-962(-)
MLPSLRQADPLGGHHSHQFADKVGYLRRARCGHGEGGVLDPLEELGLTVSIEWDPSNNHGEEGGTSSPHVDQHPVVLLPERHFGGGVGWCAAGGLQEVSHNHVVAEAKISHLADILRALFDHQNILRLQVPVGNPLAVEKIDPAHDLPEVCPCLPFINWTLVHNVVVELPPFRIVYDHVYARTLFDGFVHRDNVGVLQVLQHVHFPHHPLQVLDVLNVPLVHDLDRDLLLGLLVRP